MQLGARSALHDDRVAALLTALASAPLKREPDLDWAGLYSSGIQCSPYVGPVEARLLEGRGLGLVTSRPVQAGELLLLEEPWATSRSCGAASSAALPELTEACMQKLASAQINEQALFWSLHGQACASGTKAWQNPQLRLAIFQKYLCQMNDGNEGTDVKLPALPDRQLRNAVTSIVASNSRRTETWNSLTLLLDETQALGGLWFAASLFNHSCCANVTLSYGWSKDWHHPKSCFLSCTSFCESHLNSLASQCLFVSQDRRIILVARAAVDLAQDEARSQQALHLY